MRRAMLYGIHIQGTVNGNHYVLWGRSRGSKARQMIVKRAAGCYDGVVSRKIVTRMNRGQSVATMNSGETTYLCNPAKMLIVPRLSLWLTDVIWKWRWLVMIGDTECYDVISRLVLRWNRSNYEQCWESICEFCYGKDSDRNRIRLCDMLNIHRWHQTVPLKISI